MKGRFLPVKMSSFQPRTQSEAMISGGALLEMIKCLKKKRPEPHKKVFQTEMISPGLVLVSIMAKPVQRQKKKNRAGLGSCEGT